MPRLQKLWLPFEDECAGCARNQEGYISAIFYSWTSQGGFLNFREAAIHQVLEELILDIVVATTGMASREVYEYRVRKEQGISAISLTVGGMGHAAHIALGWHPKPDRSVYCLDGDGALLMHMGGLCHCRSVETAQSSPILC